MSAPTSPRDDQPLADLLRAAARRHEPAYCQSLEDRILAAVRSAAPAAEGELDDDIAMPRREEELVSPQSSPPRAEGWRRPWAQWVAGGLLTLAPALAWFGWSAWRTQPLPAAGAHALPEGPVVQQPAASPEPDRQWVQEQPAIAPGPDFEQVADAELTAAGDMMSLAYVVFSAEVEDPGLGALRDDARVAMLALLDEFSLASAAYAAE